MVGWNIISSVNWLFQLLEGMQIHQVPSSVSVQNVATLMKAVSSTTAGAVASSVTLPTAPGASSTINFLPQQKLVAGEYTSYFQWRLVSLLG